MAFFPFLLPSPESRPPRTHTVTTERSAAAALTVYEDTVSLSLGLRPA